MTPGENVSSYLGRLAETGTVETGRLMEACRDLGALRGVNDSLLFACEAAEGAFRVPAGTDTEREIAALAILRAAIVKARGA